MLTGSGGRTIRKMGQWLLKVIKWPVTLVVIKWPVILVVIN